MVSQSRTLILATVVNVALVLLAPGFSRTGMRRRRVVAIVLVAGTVAVSGFAVAAAFNAGSAASTAHDLAARMSRLRTFSHDTAFLARVRTDEVALQRWRATSKTFLVGEGAGATVGWYSAFDPYTPYREGSIADNSWVTVAVKGGLVLLVAFGATVVVAFLAFLRASRRATGETDRLMWRTLALCFPAFVIGSTVLTAHYLAVPGVLIAIVCLVAAADLACERGKKRPRSAS